MIKRNFALAAAAFGMLTAFNVQATVLDLTTSDEGTIKGATFDVTFQQPTGTGVIRPFLRLQANGTEQGYNTSATPKPFDEKGSPYTRDLLYSELQQCATSVNGTQYYQFLLDVNEPGQGKSLISLDNLQLYTSATGSQSTTNVSSLGTLRYSLDSNGQDNTVLIDADRNSGSGSGDVLISIPVSNFAGTLSTDYVYLYALFGNADGAETQGGFEEFAVVCNVTPVPEMSALFPIVGLLVAVGSTRVLRRRQIAKASV